MATPEQLLPTIILVASLLVILAVLVFLWSLRQFRLSRTDSYWRRRRTAGQRGLKALVWSIVLILLSGVLWIGIVLAYFFYFRPSPTVSATRVAAASSPTPTTPGPTVISSPTETATIPPTISIPTRTLTTTHSPTAPIATQTPLPPPIQTTQSPTSSATSQVSTTVSTSASTPTTTPSIQPSLTGTPSSTFTVTPTASPTLRPVNIASLTLESSVTPNSNATLKITALDTQISTTYEPVSPSQIFTAGFTRLYFFVTFSGMQPGILWRRELVQDENVIQTHSYLWGLQEDGSAYFFFGQEDGFKPGQYQIRLYLGKISQPIAEMSFVVRQS